MNTQETPLAKRISMFSHKGGVSKTTTTFHLGAMLASRGHTVLMVDADPQCNLTGLILGEANPDQLRLFYEQNAGRNIRDALQPAFESQPRAIQPVDCVEVDGIPRLLLLPGHIDLSAYEVTLGMAQELSASIPTLMNLPGAISYLLDQTAAHHGADYVLVDLNPSLSALNQNILVTSDRFLVPTAPDYFSVMALRTLVSILPRWNRWRQAASQHVAFRNAAYPFPNRVPKLLGTIVQRFRPRLGNATVGFQQWIDQINTVVRNELLPVLQGQEMLLADAVYTAAGVMESRCLAEIPDFNTLIAKSQEHRTPVFDLRREQLGHVGSVLQQDLVKVGEFQAIFVRLAEQVEALCQDAAGD